MKTNTHKNMKKNLGKVKEKEKGKEKQRSIRTKLFVGFFFPVVLLIALGIVSYTTASNTIMDNYTETALSTMEAVSMYAESVTNGISSRAFYQIKNLDLTEYYENHSDNVDPEWLTHYGNAKSNFMTLKSVEGVGHYYVMPIQGFHINSHNFEFEPGIYEKFMQSDIGTCFEGDKSIKNKWFGYHKVIDEAMGISGDDYAFTNVQKFILSDNYILIDLSMEFAETILQKTNFGPNSIISLVSQDGKEVTRTRKVLEDGTEALEKPEENIFSATELLPGAKDNKETLSDFIKWDGKKYLFIDAPVGTSGLSLCCLIPQENIVAEVAKIRTITYVFIIVSVLGAIGVGTYIAGGISKAVKELCLVLEKVAEGDMTKRVEMNRKDEFGTLANVLNKTIDNIRGLMAEMSNFGRHVNEMADGITEKSDSMNGSIRNISIGIEEVSNGLQLQAEETDRSNNRMRQFAEKLEQMNHQTEEMNGAIGGVTSAIHQGQVIINDLSQKSQTTTEITNIVVDNVDGMRKHSMEIQGIIDTIDSIAEETNLLSLNASIEAARAGEHGRGFAVVAEQIRQLADQSATAAGEVQQRLNQMSAITVKTTQSAEEAQNIVAAQGVALKETVQVFKTIEDKVQELLGGLQFIVGGMGQINTDKDEIQTSMMNISMESETAAASAQEMTATLDEQVGVISQLVEDMKGLKEEISVLEESINRFVI